MTQTTQRMYLASIDTTTTTLEEALAKLVSREGVTVTKVTRPLNMIMFMSGESVETFEALEGVSWVKDVS